MRRRAAPALTRPVLAGPVLVALLVAGCSSTGTQLGPRLTGSAGPTTAALASPARGAGDRLAALAATAAGGSYAAQYALQAGDGRTVQVVASHLPEGYRVDIVSGAVTDSLIGSSGGTVSCHREAAKASCFQAAGPGARLPDLFDAGVQHVFTDYLSTLSTSASQYQVDDAVPKASPPPAPTSQCFSVGALAGAKAPVVPSGDYCLAASGLPTLVTYGAASLVLQQVLPAPAVSVLTAPASPQPLPPSASPS